LRASAEHIRRHPGFLSLWGLSLNHDENTGRSIVDERLLRAFSELVGASAPESAARLTLGDAVAHAGVQHTYGYLFSIEKTPYGYKRARWVEGELEAGFGLPAGTLGPEPRSGSFLANVSYFAARLALADHAPTLQALERLEGGVPKELLAIDWRKITATRLRETLRLGGRVVELRTDFVPWPERPSRANAGAGNSHLLIYSARDRTTGAEALGPRLITLFPVREDFVERATARGRLGKNQPIQTRYNGAIAGVTGRSGLRGTRELLPLPLR
jgi:hypothetical protein